MIFSICPSLKKVTQKGKGVKTTTLKKLKKRALKHFDMLSSSHRFQKIIEQIFFFFNAFHIYVIRDFWTFSEISKKYLTNKKRKI